MNELLVMTEIAGRCCAMRAQDVRSVIEMESITPVPGAPDFIVGITALRSQTLTVVDCRLALGLDPAELPTDSRAAVVNASGHSYALVVDAIQDISTAIAGPEEVTGGFGDKWSEVSAGMIETTMGPVLLLNIDALLKLKSSSPGELGAAA